MTYRTFRIPKKSGFRTVCAPDDDLKAYQRKLLPSLEQYYYETVERTPIYLVAHGFLTGRNCVTAATQHIGYQYSTLMDISNFFDSVHRSMLPPTIAFDDNLFNKQGYCAQGFVTSPILANIASIPILIELSQKLREITTDHTFTIYADDICVSYNNIEHKPQIISLIYDIFQKYGFKIKSSKTRTRKARAGYRRILGINVGTDHIRASRKTMRRIRAAKHQCNYSSAGGLTTWSRNHPPKKPKL